MSQVTTEAHRKLQSLAWLPLATLVSAGLVLTWCAAADTQLYDSGELAAAAMELGGSHPPGQPLHALLAQAFTWLPIGPIPLRMGLLSVLCALAAAWLVGSLTVLLCETLGLPAGRFLQVARSAALLGTLTALPVLRQALRIEVYTLALCLFAGSVQQLFLWARDARSARLRVAALCAGLSVLVHPPHAFAAALTGACFALAQPRRLLKLRAVTSAVAFGLLPLLGLAYLPLRARAGAAMWGDPTTLAGFWDYVSGRAFMGNIAEHDRLPLLFDYASYLLHETAGVPWIGALVALRYAALQEQRAALSLLGASLSTLIAACLQPLEARNPDNVAYLAPAVTLAVAVGAAGFARLAAERISLRVASALALALLALSPATASELRARLRADVPALDSLAEWSFDSPPPRALVVVNYDFSAGSWMMARSVEGARPDIALFVRGLATSSWHWRQLRRYAAFDGRPRAAGGGDAHDRYTRGAALSALPRVPVVLERELPGLPVRGLVGPYLRVDRAPEPRPEALDDAALALIAREAGRGPPGDSGAAAAVVRDVLCQRSLRLFVRGAQARALAHVQLALWDLPESERALVHAAELPSAPQLPRIVDDPSSYLVSTEDAARQAAALLWALSERDAARSLLQRQLERGDPLALLQLAHLQASAGQRADALQTLSTLEPLLSEASRDLAVMRRALGH